MKKNRNLPADSILQYEAERNAHLLYNEVHLDAPMVTHGSLQSRCSRSRHPNADAQRTTSTNLPMPQSPPSPTLEGNKPPGTYASGLQTIRRCRPLIWRRWRWATCSAVTTSRRTSAMGTTMPSSSSEGTHSSSTMGTHCRARRPLRRVQTKDLERGRRLPRGFQRHLPLLP